jgi:hypothetical protein
MIFRQKVLVTVFALLLSIVLAFILCCKGFFGSFQGLKLGDAVYKKPLFYRAYDMPLSYHTGYANADGWTFYLSSHLSIMQVPEMIVGLQKAPRAEAALRKIYPIQQSYGQCTFMKSDKDKFLNLSLNIWLKPYLLGISGKEELVQDLVEQLCKKKEE